MPASYIFPARKRGSLAVTLGPESTDSVMPVKCRERRMSPGRRQPCIIQVLGKCLRLNSNYRVKEPLLVAQLSCFNRQQ